MKCPRCLSKNVQKRGPRGLVMRYYCKTHDGYFTVPHFKSKTDTAKVLLLDIETLYMEARGIWQLKTKYIPYDNILKDWSILCYAGKWLFQEGVFGQVVKPEESVNRTELSIIQGLWDLLNEADIVVWHNGNEFDQRAINAKFLKHDFPEPSHYLTVDTLLETRKRFRLPSYALDYLSKAVLGLDGKIHMSIRDWHGCAEGNQESLDKMLLYCKNDIAPLLEDYYLKILPWIRNHPNLNIHSKPNIKEKCPKCQGKLHVGKETWKTPQGLWRAYRCEGCGGIGRTPTQIKKVGIK